MSLNDTYVLFPPPPRNYFQRCQDRAFKSSQFTNWSIGRAVYQTLIEEVAVPVHMYCTSLLIICLPAPLPPQNTVERAEKFPTQTACHCPPEHISTNITMRLFGCRCSARRRRASLITQVLGLLLMVVVTTWVVLLVLQVGQESLTLRRSQAVSAVDYEIYKANPHHSDSVVTRNKSVNRLAETAVNNGRQPKGLDIALPAIEKHNSTIREHSTTSHPTSQPTSAIVNDTRATVMRSQNTVVVGTKEQITIDSLPSQIGPDSLQLLKDYMFKLNKEQRIQNVDKFPPMAKDGIVLIVQVHRRDGYLRQLFNSMRKVQGIEEVLLVISHDYYYDDIMKLVRSVDFCRVCFIRITISVWECTTKSLGMYMYSIVVLLHRKEG